MLIDQKTYFFILFSQKRNKNKIHPLTPIQRNWDHWFYKLRIFFIIIYIENLIYFLCTFNTGNIMFGQNIKVYFVMMLFYVVWSFSNPKMCLMFYFKAGKEEFFNISYFQMPLNSREIKCSDTWIQVFPYNIHPPLYNIRNFTWILRFRKVKKSIKNTRIRKDKSFLQNFRDCLYTRKYCTFFILFSQNRKKKHSHVKVKT